VIMRTSDGGRKWLSTRNNPEFAAPATSAPGRPGVAYSRKEGAFYISQLCFFRALPFSEVHVIKSVDAGRPGRQAVKPHAQHPTSTM